MTKRDFAGSILGSKLMRPFNRVNLGELRILAWHRICDDDLSGFKFDEGLISATTEMFRRQMQFVRSNFNVITFRDLERLWNERRSLPPRALIITFDDGYRDNYTKAFPILKEFGLPATIFLTTGHLGRAKLFWWDQVAYCVKQTARRSIIIREISIIPLSLEDSSARKYAIELILILLKQQSEDYRCKFLSGLSEMLDVEMPADLAAGMHLTWEDVKDMASHGIEFGSHTVTHPILANVSEDQLAVELFESKRAIEEHLDMEVIAFAYPAGRRSRFTPAVCQAVAAHGYRYAVAFDEGAVADLQQERFTLPRIHVERDHSESRFRANLLFTNLMFRGDGESEMGKLS